MGSELVSTDSHKGDNDGGITNSSNAPLLYTPIFESYCPVLMSMGMSYNEYWDGDNDAPKYYIKANEYEVRKKNEALWVQGRYFYDALCCAYPLYSWSPQEPIEYLSTPYGVDKQTSEEYQRQREEKHYSNNKAKFLNMMNQINAERS